MAGCCEDECSLDAGQARQRRTLRIVLAINAIMFVVIVWAALRARSAALLTDSLDNLGDAVTYGLSIFVVSKGTGAKARVAFFKGGLIFLAASAVGVQIVHRLLKPTVPVFELMGVFSLVSLAANSICLWLLWRHRDEDVNMSSVWECSRNDLATNLSVFAAAGGVWLTGAAWPDLLVASALWLMLMRSSIRVLQSARQASRSTHVPTPDEDPHGT